MQTMTFFGEPVGDRPLMLASTPFPWHTYLYQGLNGAAVIAHDAHSGATYIRLPAQLQRPIDGGCQCQECKANPKSLPTWDTLVIPTMGHAWTCHMPQPHEFRAYLAKRKAA